MTENLLMLMSPLIRQRGSQKLIKNRADAVMLLELFSKDLPRGRLKYD